MMWPSMVRSLVAALVASAVVVACGPPPKPAGLIRLEKMREQPFTRKIQARDPAGWRESDNYYRMAFDAWQSSDMDEANHATVVATILYRTADAKTRQLQAEDRIAKATQRIEVARERVEYYEKENAKLKERIATLTKELAGVEQARVAALQRLATPKTTGPAHEVVGKFKAAIDEARLALEATAKEVKANLYAAGHFNKAKNLLDRAGHEVDAGDLDSARTTLEEAKKEIAAAREEATPKFKEIEEKKRLAEKRAKLLEAARAIPGVDVRDEPRGVVVVVSDLFTKGRDPVLREERTMALDQVVKLANDFADIHLLIEGHTDASGPKSTREDRSRVYARRTMEYFTERGVDSSRLTIAAYGDTVPLESNRTRAGRAQNRRIEVVFKLRR